MLGRVNIGEIDDEGSACDEFALDRKCNSGRAAEIGEIVKVDAYPMGCPTGTFAHNGFVELNRRFPAGCVESLPVLESAAHNMEHRRWCG